MAAASSLDRRDFLAGLVAALATGCAAAPAPVVAPEGPPKLVIRELTDLMPLANLRWLILAKPRDIAAVPWLIPPIATVAPEQNLDRFAASSGLDLRQLPEAAIGAYGGEGGEAMVYLTRHHVDAAAIERLFRARFVAAERRVVDRPDVVRVSGKIGTTPAALAVLGPEVAAFQFGGSPSRGQARIAALYATEKLKKSPTALSEDPLRALAARLGVAPLRAFAVGPFEGELARGARGLLAGATAIGATARPSAREGILVVIAVAGDFTKSGEAASKELTRAWTELAEGSFGHLLGLDKPVEKPLATHGADAVSVAVEINPTLLAKGLAEATGTRLAEIMR